VDDMIGLSIGNHDLATRSIIICGLAVQRQTDLKRHRRFRHAEHRVRVPHDGSYG